MITIYNFSRLIIFYTYHANAGIIRTHPQHSVSALFHTGNVSIELQLEATFGQFVIIENPIGFHLIFHEAISIGTYPYIALAVFQKGISGIVFGGQLLQVNRQFANLTTTQV